LSKRFTGYWTLASLLPGPGTEEHTTASGVGFWRAVSESALGPVMTAVHHILDQKGHQVWSVHPGDTVYDAIKLMADKDVGALMVLDGSKIVGIVTERDYARNVFLKGRGSPHTLVGEIMACNVACVKLDKSVDECMAIMTARRVRHLPVISDDHQLLGIISIGDLVKSIISDREFVIEQLEHYIGGART
jgi:CBS domain-containing protein